MLSSDTLHEQARPWLELLDELQNLGIPHAELPVPQIAVFGDQSSGKSSLLESISGIPFPKGTGLVTKCPTRITMTNAPSKSWQATITLPPQFQLSNSDRDIIETVHSPNELSLLLERASTLITAKSSNGFSRDSIHVHVESAHTPDLSLVDLPGIIRTTTAGQDRSVINEVDELLRHYMLQQETVILAVIPANQDIATVDILERAAKLDPQGERTIGVLTKPDLVDQGAEEEILHIVRNTRKPLRLGYVMVKNRNQAELKSALSLQDAMTAEDQYFQNHGIWRSIDIGLRGTQSLCNKLTQLIVKRAVDRAPVIQLNLQEKLKSLESQLVTLGMDVPMDSDSKRKLLIRIISRFTQTLRQVAAGDYRDPIPQYNPSFRLKYIVNESLYSLQTELKQKIPNLDDDAYANKLSEAIISMKGR
jgi:interferon-induced GTP-binding protein Mx1